MPFPPSSPRLPTPAATRLRPVWAALLLCPVLAAQADAPQQRRLQVQIEMSRQGEVQAGAERGRQQLLQSWTVSALLDGDGVPLAVNMLDPDEANRPVATAPRPAAAPAAPADPARLQAMQAQAQAKVQALMARCGADQACLMREASALSAAAVARGDASLHARLQAGHAGREVGGADAPAPAEPYRLFQGAAACRLEVGVQVDARTEGRYNDVQGVVPFSETVKADERHRGDAACPLLQAVLDTRSGRLWTNLTMLPQDAAGMTTRDERGRNGRRQDGRVALRWLEAQTALQQRLARLDARGGSDVQRVAVPGGQLELRVRWRFDPA